MTLDTGKNKAEILDAVNDLLDDKTDTDWILLGYEGLSNTLRLVSTGDGGLEEMADDLNESKIMYAYVRVFDPKTSRTKNILINWQGEGTPNLRKGTCARHLPDVKRFIKGVHITVNARNEDEVEPSAIMDAVMKASATDYNFSERSVLPERNVPVGTNYSRTNPKSEINPNSRNKFWEEQEKEELVRKQEEIKRKEEEAKKFEKERLERESHEAKKREEINKQRNARILAEKQAEEKVEKTVENFPNADSRNHHNEERERIESINCSRSNLQSEINPNSRNKFWEDQEKEELVRKQEEIKRKEEESKKFEKERLEREIQETKRREELNKQRNARILAEKQAESRVQKPVENSLNADTRDHYREELERAGRADQLRMQRKKEAESIIGHTTFEKRSIFESGAHKAVSPTPINENSLPSSRISSSPIQNTSVPKKFASCPWPPVEEKTNSTVPNQTVHGKIADWSPPVNEIKESAKEIHSAIFQESVPESKSPIVPESQPHFNGNGDVLDSYPVETPVKDGTSSQKVQETYPPSQEEWQNKETEAVSPTSVKQNVNYYPVTCEIDGVEYQLLPEHGLCARALYDYEAADDTEITFDPGDIITNIDQIDVGWWQGIGPQATFGLFPANYVELLNSTQ